MLADARICHFDSGSQRMGGKIRQFFGGEAVARADKRGALVFFALAPC